MRTCSYSSRRDAEPLGVADLEQAPEVDEAGHPERAGLDHLLDDLVVDLVAVVDDVDAELDALEDHLPVGDMGADLGAALVRGLDDRGDLGARHVAVRAVGLTVTGAGEDLDRLHPARDLLADQLAELVGPVGGEVDAGRLVALPPGGRLFMSPVVPMWWPQARMRGPGMMSWAIAILSCASMSCAQDAPT